MQEIACKGGQCFELGDLHKFSVTRRNTLFEEIELDLIKKSLDTDS